MNIVNLMLLLIEERTCLTINHEYVIL